MNEPTPRTDSEIRPTKAYTLPALTLRDYFAGQALAGMLANSSARGAWATYAEHSYAQADAMIAARIHQEDAK